MQVGFGIVKTRKYRRQFAGGFLFSLIALNAWGAPEKYSKQTVDSGSFGVFMARLLPVVRHLIGIPMGIVKMDFKLYSLFTLIGSALWCSVLAWVGVKAGSDEQLMRGDLKHITLWLVGALLILSGLYYFLVHRHMKKAVKKD